MSESPHAMVTADDWTMAQLINRAKRRLIIVAPGLSRQVAEVLAERWLLLGAEAVSVTLDIDPEVCRIGYGELQAIELLERAAVKLNTTLNKHPGVRIGVVIADDETLIYSPIALHIEAGPGAHNLDKVKPNAIRIGSPPADLERDLGAGPDGVKAQVIGLDSAQRSEIEETKKNLEALPPRPFDLTRRLRVFTAHLEFVELKLTGCMIHRRTIAIPSDMVGIQDEKTRKLLESKFRLFEADVGVWGHEVHRIKSLIVERFLVHLPSFGDVLRLHDKKKFERAISTLEKFLNRARARKCDQLQTAIDTRITALHAALLPAVTAHPPARWNANRPCHDVSARLMDELTALVGNAHQLLERAKVELCYKGVTYETLQDPQFIKYVRRLMPDLKVLHHEADVVPIV